MNFIMTREQIIELKRLSAEWQRSHPNDPPLYERLPEPTPYQRGVLNRYQDRGPWRRTFKR